MEADIEGKIDPNLNLKIKIADLKKVFSHLPKLGGRGHPLENRDEDEFVNLIDMSSLYNRLGLHYLLADDTDEENEEGNDIDAAGSSALADIFHKMADEYNELD